MHRCFQLSNTSLAILLFSVTARSQSASGVVAGAGYSVPTTINVAPGQVISLFADGLRAHITEPILPTGYPLPTALAGVSVVLHGGPFRDPVPLPIVAVRRVSPCMYPGPACAAYTAVTVQLPGDIQVNQPGTGRPPYSAVLSVAEDGTVMPGVGVFPVPDSIHVLGGCDVGASATPVCNPSRIVKHLDGTQVSEDKPAAPVRGSCSLCLWSRA